eukprot:c34687_g1_i1 orf=255-737(-)
MDLVAEYGKGVPSFAYPWIEYGKLQERERCQGLAFNLLELAIVSELQDLKRGIGETIPQLQSAKQTIFNCVDLSQGKISSLISEHKKLVIPERKETSKTETRDVQDSEKKVTIRALQYHSCCSYDGLLQDIAANSSTGCIEIMNADENADQNGEEINISM